MANYEPEPVRPVQPSNGSGGVIAILVVIVVLLVAGFLYFTQYGDRDEGPDVELNVPNPEVPDVDIEGEGDVPPGGERR